VVDNVALGDRSPLRTPPLPILIPPEVPHPLIILSSTLYSLDTNGVVIQSPQNKWYGSYEYFSGNTPTFIPVAFIHQETATGTRALQEALVIIQLLVRWSLTLQYVRRPCVSIEWNQQMYCHAYVWLYTGVWKLEWIYWPPAGHNLQKPVTVPLSSTLYRSVHAKYSAACSLFTKRFLVTTSNNAYFCAVFSLDVSW
jgi:hypothetical protein